MPAFHLVPGAPHVEANGLVFVTGQRATDPDDDRLPLPDGIDAQTAKVMDKRRRVLEALGLWPTS